MEMKSFFFFAACRWFDGHSQKMPSHVQKKWESAPVVHFFGVLVQQYTSLFKDSLISRLFLLLFELKVTHNFGDTHLFRYKNLFNKDIAARNIQPVRIFQYTTQHSVRIFQYKQLVSKDIQVQNSQSVRTLQYKIFNQ